MCMRAGSFGIGTSLSNDFVKKSSGGKEKSKALNMVIKLSSVDGKPTVKISDDITKVGLWHLRAGGIQADRRRVSGRTLGTARRSCSSRRSSRYPSRTGTRRCRESDRQEIDG